MSSILLTVTLVMASCAVATPLGVLWGWSLASLGEPPRDRESSVIGALDRVGVVAGRVMIAVLVALLAMPLYIHAAAWEGAAGKFGWITLPGGNQRFWFQGILAASWIHGVYGSCWIAVATWWALRRRPQFIDDMARLDLPPPNRLHSVFLPLATSFIVAATIWCGLLAATEMTVADLYGVGTLADVVYKVYALDPEPGPVLAAVLAPAVIVVPPLMWLLGSRRAMLWRVRGSDADASPSDRNDRPRFFNHRRAESTVDGKSPRPITSLPRGLLANGRAIAPALVAIGLTTFTVVVPFASIVAKAGWRAVPVDSAVSPTGWSHRFSWPAVLETLVESAQSFRGEFVWTGIIAICAVVVALPMAGLLAVWSERHPRCRGPFLLAMVLAVMVPGPVVSLVVIELFNRPGLGWFYDRTILPTVVALLPRTVPAGYLVLRAAYRMLNQSVGECAKIDQLGILAQAFSVDLPRLWRSLAFAALAIFLISCGDLSATLLVLPPGVTTVASRLFGLLHSGVRQQEAGLTLWTAICIGGITFLLAPLVR
jgi:iron(III) transport system permease protein